MAATDDPRRLPAAVAAMRMAIRRVALVAGASWVGAVGSAATADTEAFAIRAVEGMRFDPVRKAVAAGSIVKISFENADATDQPHNVIVCRPGRRQAVLEAALALGADGPARDYVPASDDILAASPLVNAGGRAEVTVTLPAEPGVYPFVCTFPGHGELMFGALYAGAPMPPAANDPAIPKSVEPAGKTIAPDPRPMVRRIFMPDCGPASIAIALPGDQNLCWDAGSCRLRYAWQGGFVDAEAHFRSKGSPIAQLGGPVWWRNTRFPPIVGATPAARVSFRGYRLDRGLPIFEYDVDAVRVRERFEPRDGGFAQIFELTGLTQPLVVALDTAERVTITSSHGIVEDGRLRLTADEAARFELRYRRDASSTK